MPRCPSTLNEVPLPKKGQGAPPTSAESAKTSTPQRSAPSEEGARQAVDAAPDRVAALNEVPLPKKGQVRVIVTANPLRPSTKCPFRRRGKLVPGSRPKHRLAGPSTKCPFRRRGKPHGVGHQQSVGLPSTKCPFRRRGKLDALDVPQQPVRPSTKCPFRRRGKVERRRPWRGSWRDALNEVPLPKKGQAWLSPAELAAGSPSTKCPFRRRGKPPKEAGPRHLGVPQRSAPSEEGAS